VVSVVSDVVGSLDAVEPVVVFPLVLPADVVLPLDEIDPVVVPLPVVLTNESSPW